MTLIKSISGIRGTIGGAAGENLTPIDVVKFTTAYARLIKSRNAGKRIRIVVGRDARLSGELVADLVEMLGYEGYTTRIAHQNYRIGNLIGGQMQVENRAVIVDNQLGRGYRTHF